MSKAKKINNAKEKIIAKNVDDCCDFDADDLFTGFHDHDSGSDAIETMKTVVQASADQLSTALELTQMIVDGMSEEDKSEERILSVFARASKTVEQNYPLTTILDKLAS